jgi:hypothetical protein
MARQEGLRNLDDAVDRNSVPLLGGERMVSRLQLDQGGSILPAGGRAFSGRSRFS